jgi:phosphohistidine phosphatase SixA
MKNNIYLFLAISMLFISCTQKNESAESKYFLVRHAEKQVDGTKDPHLTEEGVERARSFGQLLKLEKIDLVYSTDYFRTMETASNFIDSYEAGSQTTTKLIIQNYDPRKIKENIEEFKKETAGKNVLIVGHSNTTPQFANALLGKEKYSSIDESVYGNLYILSLSNPKSTSTLLTNL